MVWQRSGTVAVQNGSTTVMGTGVDFAASSRVGDSFVGPDGATYEVANVASATVISILPAYRGATVSGASYAIMPVQGYDKMLSDAFNNLNNQFGQKLAALGTTGNYDILPADKGGTGRTALGNAMTADLVTSKTDTTAGRVVTVGYGGLGAVSNGYEPDLNLIASARMFFWGAGPTANIPSGADYGEGIAFMGGDPSTMAMMLISHDSDRTWIRRKRANTWQPWVQVYTTANTTRAADGTLKAV